MPKKATKAKRGDANSSPILDMALDQAMHLLETEPALAEEQAREILRVYEGEARAFFVLARAFRLQGDPDAARRSAEKALAIDENLVEAHIERARALIALDDRLGAIAAFETALAQDPGHARAWSALGDQLAIVGQCGAADRAYARHAKAQENDEG